MTVSTIASIAASLSRASGNNISAKAATVFNNLLSNTPRTGVEDTTNLTAALSQQNQNAQLRIASQNIAQASSLLASAEAGASSIVSDLDQLEVLVKQAQTTTDDTARAAINREVGVIRNRIDGKANTTRFNNENLLDGSSPQLKLAGDNRNIKDLSIGSLKDDALFKGAVIDVSTVAGAQAAETRIKEAKAYASKQRENIRALSNGLELASSSLQTVIENQKASSSTLDENDLLGRIYDGDTTATLLSGDPRLLDTQIKRLPPSLVQLLAQ